MAEATGIFNSANKVELIEGEVVDRVPPIGSNHADWVNRLNRYFIQLVADSSLAYDRDLGVGRICIFVGRISDSVTRQIAVLCWVEPVICIRIEYV